MEEYSNQDEAPRMEHLGDSTFPLNTNVTSAVNDGGILETNVSTKVNDDAEAILNLNSKLNELPADSRNHHLEGTGSNITQIQDTESNIIQHIEGVQYPTDNSFSSDIQEKGSSESNVLRERINDQVGLSIEDELENIHAEVNASESEKRESVAENDHKMDWADNIEKNTSSASVPLQEVETILPQTKEQLEADLEVDQVVEKCELKQGKQIEEPVESQGCPQSEEKMEVTESTSQSNTESVEIPENVNIETTPNDEAETQSIDTRVDKICMDTSTEKMEEPVLELRESALVEKNVEDEDTYSKHAEKDDIKDHPMSIEDSAATTESTSESSPGDTIEPAAEGTIETAAEVTTETAAEGTTTETAAEGTTTETAAEGTTTETAAGSATETVAEGPTETVVEGTTDTLAESITETRVEDITETCADISTQGSTEVSMEVATTEASTEVATTEASTEVATTEDSVEGFTDSAVSTQSTAMDTSEIGSKKADKIDNADSALSVSSPSEQERDKGSDSQRENTEFVQVNTESEKDSEDNEKDDESNNRALMEQDPIGSDSFEPMNNEDREGADAELCIIPDTQREISQAEKDAASTIPPLRDLSEASGSTQSDNNSEAITGDQAAGSPIIIFKYEKEDLQICNECKLKRKVKYYYTSNSTTKYLCDDNCLNIMKNSQEDKVAFNWEEGSLRVKNFSGAIKEPPSLSFIRKCATCKKVTNDIENNLTWEIMDFCNEFCLSKYQKEIGSHCSSCQGEVKSNSLGKYCVRFGNDIRQFCTSGCLEKYKKGLKVCSYCQQDMSGGPEGFLAPVGDKGQFKDFCSQLCMEKYDIMTNDRPPKVDQGTICSVCKAEKPITIEFELDGSPNYFCSEPCFVAFSFVNNISPGKCAMCRRHFPKAVLEKQTMYYDNVQHSFCSNSCENIYIIAHRKIVPCSWCKVKKYNFDMIRRYSKSGPMINMCSVNCLSLYNVSINAVNSRKIVCNYCLKLTHPMYHLTMSDATLRNFCSYNCVMGFQNQFPKQPITLNSLGESGFPVPTGAPKKNKKHPGGTESPSATEVPPLPIISSVQSLATTNGSLSSAAVPPSLTPINTRSTRSKATANATPQVLNSTPQIINSFTDLPVQVQIKQHFIVRPAPAPKQRNVATMCYTRKANKGINVKPTMVDEGVQTDEREASKILIPVPVPIYVPTPMRMFNVPTIVPVPFPIPVPVPIFIPTTRNSAAGIMKEIKKIQVKMVTDPYEAELLMMAEMVAEEKKEEVTDSESDVDDAGGPEDSYSPEPVDASNTFGDDMLQMALKMATELDEPAVDLEGALTANTITASQGGEPHHAPEESVDDPQPMHPHMMERSPAAMRGRKRGMRQTRGGGVKRKRRMSQHQVDMPMMPQQPPPTSEPAEKPDANMCLKYTFGVNAWKQWVTTKNAELEKSAGILQRGSGAMLFKTEILQLTSDELNYSLCLFVKEVRKPNGAEYAPDTIYYLCLGIQQYLFENGRIDNIFCDSYYEKFTDCLDEVAKKFSVLYNDSHYIVTRVEEEHLWESKQLGAHSPHVLLSTLMFFNTKHFNLTTVDEHMQLSFSHIMKHWKRNPNQPGASKMAGSRNVLLRFYPPQSGIQNNTRKKKVYEQEQNEENPLRCPVKLYEFYLSKCPESVKTRNDVFYLQPERSCVPDSPVWYSTMPLPREALEKMLHRVKMVKEINVALLTS